ncbi:peptide chain release factor N(5)-glutamine methyltransferase [Ideonella sp. A 288]|uniref:peptide chain release factor N(5)-glutamine methyltransferase n=1 Tax=Ideonella sp. A 288 TaxID=1962181 RepID=UPI0018FE7FCE
MPPGPTQPATVAQALAWAQQAGLDRLDAHLLLSHHLGQPRAWLLAHDGDPLPAHTWVAFQSDCQRRADDWPVAYLLGEREFHGLSLQVTPDVLVPRPDTETLVDWALDARGAGSAEVLDLGTGSGAVALALAHARPAWRVTATDLSPAALAVARGNAHRLGLAVEWRAGAWWQAVAGRRFDLVVSNPPYIAEADPHLPALRHEPALALTSGPDGLDALRAIVAGAPAHLEAGGWLLLEHGFDQAPAVRALLHAGGLDDIATRCDLAGHDRCTGGRWPGPLWG